MSPEHFLRARSFWLLAVLALPVWLIILLGDWQPSPAVQGWQSLGLVIVIYPILEELAFRGAIQGWLRQRSGGQLLLPGISLANVLSSVLFVIAHLAYQPVGWALSVFLPSLAFGYCRDRFDSVIPGMLLHIFYNAGFFLLA